MSWGRIFKYSYFGLVQHCSREWLFRSVCLEQLQVVSAVVNNDLQGLVESRPLKLWKETLALICTVYNFIYLYSIACVMSDHIFLYIKCRTSAFSVDLLHSVWSFCDAGISLDAVKIGQLFVMRWEPVLMLAGIFKQLHFATFVLVTLREPWIFGRGLWNRRKVLQSLWMCSR